MHIFFEKPLTSLFSHGMIQSRNFGNPKTLGKEVINMKKGEKLEFNYAYLRGFIRENFKTLARYADFLGISLTTLHDRLSGRTPFTQADIYKTANFSLDRKLTSDEVNLLFFNLQFRKTEIKGVEYAFPDDHPYAHPEEYRR